MGSLLELVDSKYSHMGRKVVNHSRHDGGFEAPRNSLEVPFETVQGNYAGRYSMPYAHRLANDWSQIYSAEAPVKRQISEQVSRRPNIRNAAPSVVARLMGVDMLPVDTKPKREQVQKKSELKVSNLSKEEQSPDSLGGHVSFASNAYRSKEFDSFEYKETSGANQRKSSLNLNKPKPREHPQNELLQKFKKEFETWQKARFKEYTKAVALDSIPDEWLAQEDLNKEKMALYANSTRPSDRRKPIGKRVQTSSVPSSCLQNQEKKNGSLAAGLESPGFSSKTSSPDFQQSSSASSNSIPDAPSTIVILRPGPDTIGYNEESWTSSPGFSEDRGSIEDFLEEVKERLKHEIQGKPSKRIAMARGGEIETPYSEKLSDAKQIAQRIAQQARESATGDFRMSLLHSASTRSYKSERLLYGTDSPKFNRDTRRFFTDRLRNVFKEEICQDVPMVVCGSSISSTLNDDRSSGELSVNDLDARNKFSHWDSLTNESDMQSGSLRRAPEDNEMYQEELSPWNLVRSFSAPVSGRSASKLLLEDHHMLTGKHIRRKSEVIPNITLNVKNRKKGKPKFREKFSNFKYTLRGRLFGRKIQSVEESHDHKDDAMKSILNGPTVLMNYYYDRLENSTEVPPSPASICGSAQEEFWKPVDYFSPTPTSDVHSVEENMVPQVFKEISSNLNELRRQMNQLEGEGTATTISNEQQNEVEMPEIQDEMESYVRDLLVCSGLYDGSCDTSLSRWDPLGKPISYQVFEEVEESHRQRIKDDEGSLKNQDDNLNHKILFDLLNEALPTIVGTLAPACRFKKKAIGSTMLCPLRGKKLLDRVWEIIRVLLNPPEDTFDCSIDNMVAQDFQCTPWSKSIDDDVNALGKEIEYQIIGHLIEEMVEDMQS